MKLKKSRGQHLLTDKNMISRIVREAEVTKEDNIIEIGPGTGLLTEQLVKSAGRIVAFEIDYDFKEALEELQAQNPNLEIKMGDFLKFDLGRFLEDEKKTWRVVANIPYYITSSIIEKLIEEGRGYIKDIHLLIQKEVAKRIVAPPGNKDYGRLSVFLNFFCECKVLFTVPPSVFVPPPKVDSAVIKMTFKDKLPDINTKIFFSLVLAAFSKRRKQIKNALKEAIPGLNAENIENILKSSGIDPQRRGETLSMQDFETLARNTDKVICNI